MIVQHPEITEQELPRRATMGNVTDYLSSQAEEIERLEGELAAAHARIAELEKTPAGNWKTGLTPREHRAMERNSRKRGGR